jgi:hypothetical protein
LFHISRSAAKPQTGQLAAELPGFPLKAKRRTLNKISLSLYLLLHTFRTEEKLLFHQEMEG